MRMIITLSLAVVVLTLGVSGAAAQAVGHGYLGVGIGNTFFSTDVQDALDELKSIDENSTAWKIFGGYKAPRFIGIEGGYRDFGNATSTVSDQGFESKLSGWDVEAVGRLDIAIFEIFAKGGAMFWKEEVTLLGQTTKENGTDFLYGVGGAVNLGPLGLRVEWEAVNQSDPNSISMVSMSGTFAF